MRLNKFLAINTGLSRRSADNAIMQGKITVNGQKATLGAMIIESDDVELDGIPIKPKQDHKIIIILNKPVGYVCSKDGQGSPTVYDLLPAKYANLNIAGRLDKDSSGLLMLTNDGDLLNQLTHPKFIKNKIYHVTLNKPLIPSDQQAIQKGVMLQDGLSKLGLKLWRRDGKGWQVTMHEGRNRQIRRTFNALGYKVVDLHRTSIGPYNLNNLKSAEFKIVVNI